MTKINKKKFQEAIKNTRGIITLIAKNLGTTRKAVYDYMEKHPKCKQLLNEEREKPFDMAESVVFQKLNEKDIKAAEILLLKHKKGRERGYGEKQEVEHSTPPGKDFNIKITDPYDEGDSNQSVNERPEEQQS